jgi:hypothetical protein
MATASRLTLRQELAQRLHGSEAFLTGSATAAGSVTTLVDSALISTTLSNNHFVGYWLHIDSHDSDAAPEGEVRMVSQYANATGTLTVDPAFTAAPASSTNATYELHPKFHPDRLNEALNWALEVGSNNAYAAITDDDASSAIYDKEVLIEGALYYLKQGMSREEGLGRDRRVELTEQWRQHFENWMEALDQPGKPLLPELEETQ